MMIKCFGQELHNFSSWLMAVSTRPRDCDDDPEVSQGGVLGIFRQMSRFKR